MWDAVAADSVLNFSRRKTLPRSQLSKGYLRDDLHRSLPQKKHHLRILDRLEEGSYRASAAGLLSANASRIFEGSFLPV